MKTQALCCKKNCCQACYEDKRMSGNQIEGKDERETVKCKKKKKAIQQCQVKTPYLKNVKGRQQKQNMIYSSTQNGSSWLHNVELILKPHCFMQWAAYS